MAEEYKLQKEIIQALFKNLCNPEAFNIENNRNHIVNILLTQLDSGSVDAITHLMLSEKEFEPTAIGDYVRLAPYKYHIGSEFEVDVLEDMGLLHPGDENEPYYIYGQVIQDGSWNSSDLYNPFYSTIKIKLCYHDSEKKIKFLEHSVSPLHAIKVNKDSIPYFSKINQTKLKL